jgi:hypothetical protein
MPCFETDTMPTDGLVSFPLPSPASQGGSERERGTSMHLDPTFKIERGTSMHLDPTFKIERGTYPTFKIERGTSMHLDPTFKIERGTSMHLDRGSKSDPRHILHVGAG